jgi:phosphoglycerate-specific signal transduction histidine kinase
MEGREMTEPVPTDTAWALYTLADQAADWRRRAEQAIARAERAEAELERTREVVRVAELIVDSWRNSSPHGPIRDLIAAVDALRTDKEGADG